MLAVFHCPSSSYKRIYIYITTTRKSMVATTQKKRNSLIQFSFAWQWLPCLIVCFGFIKSADTAFAVRLGPNSTPQGKIWRPLLQLQWYEWFYKLNLCFAHHCCLLLLLTAKGTLYTLQMTFLLTCYTYRTLHIFFHPKILLPVPSAYYYNSLWLYSWWVKWLSGASLSGGGRGAKALDASWIRAEE